MRPTDARQLAELMVGQGWTVERTANQHYLGKHPDGKGMVTFADSRDPSAIKNATFQARRAGLRIDNPSTELGAGKPEEEKPMAGAATDEGLIRKKRVLVEKCEVSLTGQQLAEAVYQYIQKKTGIYPPNPTVRIIDEEGEARSHEDVELKLEWNQERALKEGEVA